MNYKYERLSYEQTKQVLINLNICNLRIENDGKQYTLPMHYTFRQDGDNFVFTLKDSLSSENMRLLEANPKVALEFIEREGSVVRTAVALGTVQTNLPLTQQYKKVSIKIKSMQISGRGYRH
ncbi:MAG: hypothetical protein EOM05_06450 [Clostridia bacterium]|nr:hypothetical protein [Clostridia bacterium]